MNVKKYMTVKELQVVVNRRYMKALRELLGLRQYDILRIIRDDCVIRETQLDRVDQIIRESQISCIEGKIGYEDLYEVYASYYSELIATSNHSRVIKDIMEILLNEWIRA